MVNGARRNDRIRMAHTVFVVAVFMLCVRFLQFEFLLNIPWVKTLYAILSRICAVAVMLWFLVSFRKVPKMLYVSLCAIYGCMFLATVINGGNLRILIGSAYPVLALNAFSILMCLSVASAKKYIKVLSAFFSIVATINLVFMFVTPELFNNPDISKGNVFFMGLENLLGYPCVVGLFLVLLNDYLNKEKWKVQWYVVVYGLTMALNFSVGSMMGAIVLLGYLVLPFVRKLFRKFDIMFFAGLVGTLLVIFIFFNEAVLGFPPIRFVIENVLGKDITLTNRTIIWDVAMEKILEHPIWGYGVGDTGNVFTIANIDGRIATYSAHNQFLQTWYEGGTITMIAFVVFLLTGSVLLKRSSDKQIPLYTSLAVTTLLIMILTEAPGFDSIYFVLNLGVSLVLCLEQDQKNIAQIRDRRDVKKHDKITVVVPVYNVRDYVGECLDSVINQTYKNLEIIVVNDGSTDGSYEICKAYAEKDSRIILIDQQNQGLSGARNSGIRIATGKYITFVDSDDVICPDMIEYLYHLLTAHNSDMSVCQPQLLDEDGNRIAGPQNYQDKVFCGKEDCMKALLRDDELSVTAWGKLYKTVAFKAVEYAVGKYHEDVYTTYQLVAQCEHIVAGAQPKYLYRQRGGSIVHANFSPKHLDAVEGNILQAQFMEKHYPDLRRDAQGQIIWSCNSCAMRMKNSTELDEAAVSYLQKHYRKYEGAFLLGNYRMMAKLFSIVAYLNLRVTLKLLMTFSKIRR